MTTAASTFMDVQFHRVGEHAHAEAVAWIRAIPGVEVLLDHTCALGWTQRQRLLIDEWDCRVVLEIRDQDHERIQDRLTTERDPYRFLDFGGPIKQVPSALAQLIAELDATYALVERGWVRFETRSYEAALLDSLAAELIEVVGRTVTPKFARTGGVLQGRFEGHIPTVRTLHRRLLRSGLIDADRVHVGYA